MSWTHTYAYEVHTHVLSNLAKIGISLQFQQAQKCVSAGLYSINVELLFDVGVLLS